MLTKVGCVSGCQLVVHQAWNSKKSPFRKKTYELWCSHGLVIRNKGKFIYGNFGQCNMTKEHLKQVKSIGATKAKVNIFAAVVV